ncbi:MAG: hypothetical protein JSV57_03810 [Candidatus Bathyarchaeota archaeon]|nr:MAG: hypothetical protein JSV57_03810 [Candidatus Bathyarchaeota archaeon]
MKTYLKIWFSSEGAGPVVVAEKLRNMGFEPIKGRYDHVYDWGRKVDLENVLQIGTAVHETLKGLEVLYKLETL